ncbi:hypothetical protein [Saccharopolyspora sp. CA-218241]|uniref:hypothetical protein n=1 Tax=Saccharopolyspora sp. CA-218241 TaxID=3240027 RepID=UPI003D95B39A
MPRGAPRSSRTPHLPAGPHQQHPQYQGFPQPPQYPQPGPFPQPGQQPPRGSGPWTRPGWGLIPSALGLVVASIGMFALEWADGAGMFDLARAYGAAIDRGLITGSTLLRIHLEFGTILLVVLMALYSIAWSAGAVRGRKTALLVLGSTGKSVRAGKLTGMRIMVAGCELVVGVMYLLLTLQLFDFDAALLGPGVWTVFAGFLLMAAGSAIGPRR